MSDTVLVTGARGAVGSGVLAGLRTAGVDVRAAGRDPGALPDDVGRVRLDLADPASYGPALDGVRAVFCYVTGDLAAFGAAAARAGVEVADSLLRYWEQTLDRPAPVTSEVADRTGHPARSYASWVADTL